MAHSDADSDSATVTDELDNLVDVEHLADRLEGRDGGLRTSKPTAQGDTGLEQYVWRKARFHSGADDSMPVMAHSWLQTWLDEQGVDAKVSGVMNDAGHDVTEYLDDVVVEVLEAFGYDPSRGARRWKKAGAF